MKTKYMMSWGLAFAEKYEMKKLEKKAAQGWLLESFGFLGYNLIQGPKQEITYTLDIQPNLDKDYFDIFKSAGWRHMTSTDKHLHIFSAPKGTAPIYSDNEIAEGKYQDSTAMFGKGAFYSFIALIAFSVSTTLSKSHFDFMFYPLLVLTVLSFMIFAFSFMPFIGYKYQYKMNEIDEGKEENIYQN